MEAVFKVSWGAISVSREADVVGYQCSLEIAPFTTDDADYSNESLGELVSDLVTARQVDLDESRENMIRPLSLMAGIFGRDFPIEKTQLKMDRDLDVGGVKFSVRKGVVVNKGRFTSLKLTAYTTNKECLLWQGEIYNQMVKVK